MRIIGYSFKTCILWEKLIISDYCGIYAVHITCDLRNKPKAAYTTLNFKMYFTFGLENIMSYGIIMENKNLIDGNI